MLVTILCWTLLSLISSPLIGLVIETLDEDELE